MVVAVATFVKKSRLMGNKERIVKNTAFLYFRMILTMLVTLYTSRVVLQVLGIDDFGLYQTVGGVVALLSFINTALSAGSSRFLTFELGKKDPERLRKTFSSVLIVHAVLAIIVVLLAETVGLWFVYQKLVIPPDRLASAAFAYHFSVLTIFFSITQVPYNASIISHEKMAIYAYLSILEVFLKLAVVYLLQMSAWDKLKIYAVLLCVVQIGIALSYRLYCRCKFNECRATLSFDSTIVKNVLNYSSWNLLTNTAAAAVLHGTTVLTNMFFSPSVVAARAIANQLNGAATHLVNNFRNAVNPQIVKKLANDDLKGSKHLLLVSSKISFFLMLFLCMPACLVADTLMRLWLGVVPDYSVAFLRLALVTTLFQTLSQSFYTALYAKGQIRDNAIYTSAIGFVTIGLIFVLFKSGFSAVSLAWCMLIEEAFLAIVVKSYLIVKIADYQWEEVFSVFLTCLKVTICAVPVPIGVFIVLNHYTINEFLRFGIIIITATLFVGISVWFVGLEPEIKSMLKYFFNKIKNKIIF